MRIYYREAIRLLERNGKTRQSLLDAIDAGNVEVRCKGKTQFNFCVSDHNVDEYGRDDVIYIHPLLLDRQSGIIRIQDIAKLQNGFHRWVAPPHWHVYKKNKDFTLYLCANEGVHASGSRVLDIDFLLRAELLPDGSAFVDDLDILLRQHVYDVTVDYQSLERLMAIEAIPEKGIQKSRGAPLIYGNKECNAAFIDWFRVSPLATSKQQVEKLRSLYKEKGLGIGKEVAAKTEKRIIKVLLAERMPTGTNPK